MKKITTVLAVALVLVCGCKKDNGKNDGDDKTPHTPAGVVTVDLGLGVLWADRNIGATSVTDAGYFFSWGESVPMNYYNEYDYDYVFDKIETPEKLTIGYDTAIALWGNGWRMPTREEVKDLFNLSKVIEEENGRKLGITFSGKGNSIFIPAVDPDSEHPSLGFWTSERSETYNYIAYYGNWVNERVANTRREYAKHVRPVKDK